MEIGEVNSLETVLYRDWKRVIVDAGSAGRVSVKAKNGDLLIMADDQLPMIRFGKNSPEKGSEVLPIHERVGEISLPLQDKVDFVLCVAPDPRDVVDIAADSETMLKKNGKMLFVIDLRSNLKHEVDPAIEDLKARYRGSIYKVDIKKGGPNGIVRGETHLDVNLQSQLMIDTAIVAIVKRFH